MDKPTQKILRLARSFPCLVAKLRNWNPTEFDPDEFYVKFTGASHVEWLCALFVLNVWNPGDARQKEWGFDLFDFAGAADPDNRQALMNWLAQPDWP